MTNDKGSDLFQRAGQTMKQTTGKGTSKVNITVSLTVKSLRKHANNDKKRIKLLLFSAING